MPLRGKTTPASLLALHILCPQEATAWPFRSGGYRGGRAATWTAGHGHPVGTGTLSRSGPHHQAAPAPDLLKEPAMTEEPPVPQPTVFILYGATGDLAHRLVLPAFYQLAIAGLLPDEWRLVGNGRGDVAHEDFQERVRKSLEEFGPKPSEGPWEEFRSRLRFAGGGFDGANPGCLLDVLHEAQEEVGGQPQLVHYMAVPPAAFGPLTE